MRAEVLGMHDGKEGGARGGELGRPPTVETGADTSTVLTWLDALPTCTD